MESETAMFHRSDFDDGVGADEKDNDEDEFEELYKLELKPRRVTFAETPPQIRLITPSPRIVVTEIKPNKPKVTVNQEHYCFDAPTDFIFTCLDAISPKEDEKLSIEKNTTKHTISYSFDCGFVVKRSALWRLKFTCKEDKSGEKYIEPQLCVEEIRWEDPEDTARVHCNLQLLDDESAFVASQSSPELIVGEGKTYCRKFRFSRFVSYETLIKNKNQLGKGACFHLQMDIVVVVPKKERNEFKRLYMPKKTLESSDKLYGDLWLAKPPDVKIEAGGKTFKSHKGLLAARSPGFARLLEEHSKMDDAGRIKSSAEPILLKFDNIGCDTMNSILEYMYTGQVNIVGNFGMLKELFLLAEEYRIYFFKKHLLATLDNVLTVENVTDVIEFADQNDVSPEVYHRIITFCEENFEKPDNNKKGTPKTGNPKVKKSKAPTQTQKGKFYRK